MLFAKCFSKTKASKIQPSPSPVSDQIQQIQNGFTQSNKAEKQKDAGKQRNNQSIEIDNITTPINSKQLFQNNQQLLYSQGSPSNINDIKKDEYLLMKNALTPKNNFHVKTQSDSKLKKLNQQANLDQINMNDDYGFDKNLRVSIKSTKTSIAKYYDQLNRQQVPQIQSDKSLSIQTDEENDLQDKNEKSDTEINQKQSEQTRSNSNNLLKIIETSKTLNTSKNNISQAGLQATKLKYNISQQPNNNVQPQGISLNTNQDQFKNSKHEDKTSSLFFSLTPTEEINQLIDELLQLDEKEAEERLKNVQHLQTIEILNELATLIKQEQLRDIENEQQNSINKSKSFKNPSELIKNTNSLHLSNRFNQSSNKNLQKMDSQLRSHPDNQQLIKNNQNLANRCSSFKIPSQNNSTPSHSDYDFICNSISMIKDLQGELLLSESEISYAQ